MRGKVRSGGRRVEKRSEEEGREEEERRGVLNLAVVLYFTQVSLLHHSLLFLSTVHLPRLIPVFCNPVV